MITHKGMRNTVVLSKGAGPGMGTRASLDPLPELEPRLGGLGTGPVWPGYFGHSFLVLKNWEKLNREKSHV